MAPKYKPLKGDEVDKLIADWIFANNCPIPISRMGSGYYKFGSKKIYAKITNGKLVIRVGGGYMAIDEFMYYYGAQELNKMLAYEEIDLYDDDISLGSRGKMEDDKNEIINQFDDDTMVVGAHKIKKRLGTSPRNT